MIHLAADIVAVHHYDNRLSALIREHHDDIARSIVLEQGKTFADAKGDVLRGLQVSSRHVFHSL